MFKILKIKIYYDFVVMKEICHKLQTLNYYFQMYLIVSKLTVYFFIKEGFI